MAESPMPDPAKPLSRRFEVGIALGLILSIVTCGLYNIYWNYLQFEAMNELLGRREYDFVKWLLLSIITCGMYHVYYEYKMGRELQEYLESRGASPNPNLGLVGLFLSFFGLTVLADAVYQHELNKLIG